MSGLRDFGKLTALGIEANIGPAHDAALHGDEYEAGQPGVWLVQAVPAGREEKRPEPHVAIYVYAG